MWSVSKCPTTTLCGSSPLQTEARYHYTTITGKECPQDKNKARLETLLYICYRRWKNPAAAVCEKRSRPHNEWLPHDQQPAVTRTGRRGRRTSYFSSSLRLVLGCALNISPVRGFINGSLSFQPAVVGFPSEVTFSFTPTYNVSEGKFVRLYLSGFTTGSRNGSSGEDVGFNNEDNSGNAALVWPSDTFSAWWHEGTPEEEFEDSLLNLYTITQLSAGKEYTAVFDRSSGIMSNCGHPTNSSGFYGWVDDTTGYSEFGTQYFTVAAVEAIPMACYAAPTSLTYDPPIPRVKTHITVGFQPARDLVAGDNVTVNLKGFTSGKANGTMGPDFALGDLELSIDSSDYWLAGWDEGDFVSDQSGFEGSTLRLQAIEPISAGEWHEVVVYRSNGIRAQCGLGENASSSTISIQSASTPPWNSSHEFSFTQTMGSGCKDLNNCSERGECNYCLQTCNCADGFGSDADLVGRDIANDCSGRVCPSGVSWAPVLEGHPRPDPGESHAKAECSNMGSCNRATGTCNCETGFEGIACERYSCPNGCFGHGSCRNIREMGLMSTATPLVNATGETGSNDTDEDGWGFEVAYGWRVPAGSLTWDSRSVFGCVCDSSWKVGLGQGDTQEAEYFGADCSLLHCPSGDDPETDDDETDCANKIAEGGRGMGSEGNLCHVDCSNRGLCDYSTGVCDCFEGYHGQACNMKQIDGYGFNTDGV